MRIKTSNKVKEEEIKRIEKTVQCPHCNTILRDVPRYVVQLHCWYCNKDFKIEQNPDEWVFDEDITIIKRTMTI